MTSSTGGSLGTQGRVGPTSNVQPGISQTGTPDPIFDLVSVLYHRLESAATCQQYVQDAQGDQELAQFFQQCIQQDKQAAEKVKQLLARRLAGMNSGH